MPSHCTTHQINVKTLQRTRAHMTHFTLYVSFPVINLMAITVFEVLSLFNLSRRISLLYLSYCLFSHSIIFSHSATTLTFAYQPGGRYRRSVFILSIVQVIKPRTHF